MDQQAYGSIAVPPKLPRPMGITHFQNRNYYHGVYQRRLIFTVLNSFQAKMQAYQYQPLPSSSSIRILILHPAAEASSALECDVITKDRLTILRDPHNKTFDAVSYVWGNGAHDIPLYCRFERTYLYISAVVDEMLRNLRNGHKEKRLWVDALCLNQKDNQEKSIQVQQMGQIYHTADKVHIWLGPAMVTTPSAFAFLRTLVAKFEPTPRQARTPTAEEILQIFGETCQHRDLKPILDILQKPWFTRRWTLQEGFLARNAIVRCGSSKAPWHWFTGGLKIIQKVSQQLQNIQNDNNALYAINVLQTLSKPADLLSLLWTLHVSECSDPRDRIYSLLGLAQRIIPAAPNAGTIRNLLKADSDSKEELPIPDYKLSADVVYRTFAGHCSSTDRFLQILLHIDAFGRLSDVNSKWPSWVPNWMKPREKRLKSPTATSAAMAPIRCINDPFHYIPRRAAQFSRATSFDELVYRQPKEYSTGDLHGLVIYGKRFQENVETCSPWPASSTSDHLVKFLADWIHQESILHMPDQELCVHMMRRQVIDILLLLITGSDFFGYGNHTSSDWDMELHNWWSRGRPFDDSWSPCRSKCQRIADLLYPIARETCSYTSEQLHLKKHLDGNYNTVPSPTAKSRQELSNVLDDVSRMMREGEKQLIAASCEDYHTLGRRHWIAPSDARVGDIITDISYCGRIGALLRPINFPSELNHAPVFQLIGILYSLGDFKPSGYYNRSEHFLIL